MNWCFLDLGDRPVMVPADAELRLRAIDAEIFHVLIPREEDDDLVIYRGQLATLEMVETELVPDWMRDNT